MTGPAQELLPPEIAQHAMLEAVCPHCGEELELDLATVWQGILRGYPTRQMNDPDYRHTEFTRWSLREPCPACNAPVSYSLTPLVSYRLEAVAPDPLEAYTPNSRYWEAQKRGLPTSPNLRLAPAPAQEGNHE